MSALQIGGAPLKKKRVTWIAAEPGQALTEGQRVHPECCGSVTSNRNNVPEDHPFHTDDSMSTRWTRLPVLSSVPAKPWVNDQLEHNRSEGDVDQELMSGSEDKRASGAQARSAQDQA